MEIIYDEKELSVHYVIENDKTKSVYGYGEYAEIYLHVCINHADNLLISSSRNQIIFETIVKMHHKMGLVSISHVQTLGRRTTIYYLQIKI